MDARKTKLAKRDSRRRIRQVKGKLASGKNARFQIADRETSDAEAERRLATIHSLYEKQCKRFGLDHWGNWTWQVANEIGAGRAVTDAFLMTLFNEATMAATAVQLKEWGIAVHLKSDEQFREGMAIHREQIETMVSDLVQLKLQELKGIRGAVVEEIRLPDAMIMTEGATLFDALDAYCVYLDERGGREETGENRKSGEVKAKVYKNIKDVGRLKAHFGDYENLPLWKLDLPRWESLVAIWRNRPLTKKKERCSDGWAEQQIKLLYRFGRWLHTSPRFKWRKPEGFDDVDRKRIELPEDDNSEVFQTITKATYTPQELALIMEDCSPFHKAIIATCVNCAFGQSEIGQWKTSRVVLKSKHPHAAKIDFESSDEDSWIVGPRPKTKLYGEHLLWPEVAKAIRPYLKDRSVLWITKTGKPIYKRHSKQPSSEIDNWWTGHIKKVQQKHSDLPSLPFGSLRDVLPNILTRDYGENVATLALQHKTFPEDKLLKCYANLPFKQLFKATKELHEKFKPMLTALEGD
jgi:hypothetical protein